MEAQVQTHQGWQLSYQGSRSTGPARFYICILAAVRNSLRKQSGPNRGDFCPYLPGDIGQCLEVFLVFLVVTAGVGGEGLLLATLGYRPGFAVKHPTMHRLAPTTKNCWAPNVSSADVEKPRSEGRKDNLLEGVLGTQIAQAQEMERLSKPQDQSSEAGTTHR